MKKYPEDAAKVYETFVEHSKRIERLIHLFQREQERVYKKINALMESMAVEEKKPETGLSYKQTKTVTGG